MLDVSAGVLGPFDPRPVTPDTLFSLFDLSKVLLFCAFFLGKGEIEKNNNKREIKFLITIDFLLLLYVY